MGRWHRAAVTEGQGRMAKSPSTISLRETIPFPMSFAHRED